MTELGTQRRRRVDPPPSPKKNLGAMNTSTLVAVVVLGCAVLAEASFGCGSRIYEGNWQGRDVTALLVTAFCLKGMTLVTKVSMSCKDNLSKGYTAGGTFQGASSTRAFQQWAMGSLMFCGLFIGGVTQLEGYEDRATMGNDRTKTMLIIAGSLLGAGPLTLWNAFRRYQRDDISHFLGVAMTMGGWIMIAVATHYRHPHKIQMITWFGTTAALEALIPWIYNKRINDNDHTLTVPHGIMSLVALAGQIFTLIGLLHGPC